MFKLYVLTLVGAFVLLLLGAMAFHLQIGTSLLAAVFITATVVFFAFHYHQRRSRTGS